MTFKSCYNFWKSSPYLEFYVIFPNNISSSVGSMKITLTCINNEEKQSIEIPEEATLYCKSAKNTENKVNKTIFWDLLSSNDLLQISKK